MRNTNKPHHGIVNSGVLTWVNEPKAVAMSERLTDMIAEDFQNSEKQRRSKRLRKRRKNGAYYNWKVDQGYKRTLEFLKAKYPYKF